MRASRVVLATFVASSLGLAVPAEAADRLLHHSIDRASGAIVRVFKTSAGTRVELETPSLKLQRETIGTRIVTAIREDGENLTVSFDRGVLTVAGRNGRLTATREQPEKLEAARQLLAASPLTRHALAIVQRLGFGSNSPVLPLFVTTRAFLTGVIGQSARPAADIAAGLRPVPVSDARLVKASFSSAQEKLSSSSPTDCWNAYAKEAIAAWMEYEDCIKDLKWYEVLDSAACAVVYDMRAVGAFSWWMKCVALN